MAQAMRELNNITNEVRVIEEVTKNSQSSFTFEQLSQEQLENAAKLLLEHPEYLTDETLNMIALEILRRDSNIRATLNPTEIRRWRDGNPEQAAIADIILEVAAGARNLILMPYTKELGETINNGIKNNKSLWKRLFSKSRTEIIKDAYELLAESQLLKEEVAKSKAQVKDSQQKAEQIIEEAEIKAEQIIQEAEETAKRRSDEIAREAKTRLEEINFEISLKEDISRKLSENPRVEKVFQETASKQKNEKLNREIERFKKYPGKYKDLVTRGWTSFDMLEFFSNLIHELSNFEQDFGKTKRCEVVRVLGRDFGFEFIGLKNVVFFETYCTFHNGISNHYNERGYNLDVSKFRGLLMNLLSKEKTDLSLLLKEWDEKTKELAKMARKIVQCKTKEEIDACKMELARIPILCEIIENCRFDSVIGE
ncbi:MAG: hypothetical protein HYW77_02010 [Parcubacteria group bacterium]|nr:hypothetical protein [Parcubacteria group bacterium]